MPVCGVKGEHSVAMVHGDDITMRGERSVVEFIIKMISRKYEIKKQGTETRALKTAEKC